MFFANAKDQMEESLRQEEKEYQKIFQETLRHSEVLFEVRKSAVETLHSCEEYIQTISNRPYEYDLKRKKINQDYQKFEKQLKKYKYKGPQRKFGMMLGTSTAAGAGIALFGPNAALAAATTFGTASTGAAISSLGGAAATNAALAWLGGGALTAGGAGVVGGQALLALAGPIGIAIGVSGAIAAGVKMVSDNKKKAQNAEIEIAKMRTDMTRLQGIQKRVAVLKIETEKLDQTVRKELTELQKMKVQDYSRFSNREVLKLRTMLNNSQSLAVRINELIPISR